MEYLSLWLLMEYLGKFGEGGVAVWSIAYVMLIVCTFNDAEDATFKLVIMGILKCMQ